MEHMGYEPFGERLVPERDDRPRSPVSKYLLWAGTGLFWSLVGAIVLARAAYFQPGIFDGFDRVVALAGSVLAVF
jgi:hypothetical protein